MESTSNSLENEFDDKKNKFDAIILEKYTESYSYFTTEINHIDRFIAVLGVANEIIHTSENLGKIRHIFADPLEDPKNERFKALSSAIRNGELDYWFPIDTYQHLLGQFFYARCVDNMIMYLKNRLLTLPLKKGDAIRH